MGLNTADASAPSRLESKARVRNATWFEDPRRILVGIAVLMMSLIGWSALASIDQVVRVEGKIIPAGRSRQIQHLEGGIVSSIDTSEGSTVKKGDLLLTIDNTTAEASLADVRIKLNSQRARSIRLDAEISGRTTLNFPADLAALPVADAERHLFQARRTKLDQEIAVHQGAINQRKADIEEVEQRHSRLVAEKDTARQRLDMEQTMASHGAASRMEVLEAQSRDQRLKTEIGEAEGSIPKLRAAIAEESARIETAKADFAAQAHNDLVATLEEIDRLRQGMTASTDRLKRTEIRAPADGVINHLAVNSVGGVVKPGETIVELTPTTRSVVVEAKASPRDRGYLRTGLDAQIRLSAFDAAEMGLLKGRVIEVGSDSQTDPRNESYYQVDIQIDALPASYGGRDIVPGMVATADIVTGKRTILAYLLSPIRKFTYAAFRDPR